MKKFVRTRGSRPQSPQPPPLPALAKTNGHANGVGGARRDDQHSTLSRYWSGSEECGAGAGVRAGAGPPLWEDPDFPPARALPDKRRAAAVQWRRPYELCANPTFFGEEVAGEAEAESAAGAAGAGCQDEIGADRWRVEADGAGVLSCGALWRACAALCGTPRLLARVAPPQSFRVGYCGLFRFRFWVWSEWREVRVDDRLPTRAGRLLGSRAVARADFTLPLLEKAYAKLYGSYPAVRDAALWQALQDASGGVVQSFPLQPPAALTFHVLNSAVPRSTLLVATAAHQPKHTPRLGLIGGHPYCVSGLARVRAEAEAEAGAEAGALVRLRAAAGGAWRGAWGPPSAELAALAAADRDLLAAGPDEFWMSFAEFSARFARLELVHVGPDDWLREPALRTRRPWRAVLARRRWRRGYNAGGPSDAPTARANPHFHVQVTGSRKCHVVVAVSQQYWPERARRLHAVGFAVYELPPGAAPRDRARAPLDVTHECRAREVATFFTLPAGRYVVVPHTRPAHTDAAFLLRILTDESSAVWELNDDNALLRDLWREVSVDPAAVPPEVRHVADKMLASLKPDQRESIDAEQLRALLRRHWRALLPARPSRELCRALVALRDAALSGRLPAHELPALAALLAYWRPALTRGRACGGAVSAYGTRALLRAAGVAASNKVVECVVLRFARGLRLPPDAALLALARLHLAHERYRSLDTKMKSNPLSLEEMILMTIYS
ncbi:calpain-9 isoform X2 [Amyelois transitella]|uniref:calpain-9 isoform X2 n=1 Tax=Amyelois transitella TaxID=680683 RepID=UPI00298FA881|nr:calpain-9 isoform X2 [Amyelois transitella]